MMKSFALFLLLTGVLTAGAKTLVDENLPGEIEDAELTDGDLDSLKSAMKERALAGELSDDDVDFMKSVMEERGLAMEADDDNDDLEKAAMDERALTADLDEDGADLEKSSIEERALTEDLDDADTDLEKSTIEERGLAGDATGAQPVDVARRRLRCKRWKIIRVCYGARVTSRGIVLYLSVNGFRWRGLVRVRRSYIVYRKGRFSIEIRDINLRAKTFRIRIKYKLFRIWGKTRYIRKTWRIRL